MPIKRVPLFFIYALQHYLKNRNYIKFFKEITLEWNAEDSRLIQGKINVNESFSGANCVAITSISNSFTSLKTKICPLHAKKTWFLWW